MKLPSTTTQFQTKLNQSKAIYRASAFIAPVFFFIVLFETSTFASCDWKTFTQSKKQFRVDGALTEAEKTDILSVMGDIYNQLEGPFIFPDDLRAVTTKKRPPQALPGRIFGAYRNAFPTKPNSRRKWAVNHPKFAHVTRIHELMHHVFTLTLPKLMEKYDPALAQRLRLDEPYIDFFVYNQKMKAMQSSLETTMDYLQIQLFTDGPDSKKLQTRLDRLSAVLDKRNSDRTRWVTALVEQDKVDSDAILTRHMLKLNYEEAFNDLTATFYYRDPKAIVRGAPIGTNWDNKELFQHPKAARRHLFLRNYSRRKRLKKWDEEEQHIFFQPTVTYLWTEYLKRPRLQGKFQETLHAIADAMTSELSGVLTNLKEVEKEAASLNRPLAEHLNIRLMRACDSRLRPMMVR